MSACCTTRKGNNLLDAFDASSVLCGVRCPGIDTGDALR